MNWKRAARFICLGFALSYCLPLACGSGGVVGGKCRSGYTNCNGRCLDLQTDIKSCGACGKVCEGDLACVRGLCGGEDGGITLPPVGGASSSGGASGEAGNDGSGGFAGELPDGGFLDAPVDGEGDASVGGNGGNSGNAGSGGSGGVSGGSAGSGGDAGSGGMPECLPPHDVPAHCGDCDTQCAPPEPLCAPDGNGSFECVPTCQPPLVECRGQCLDPATYNSDPMNCGRCGNVCPSGICQAGACVGAKYGNLVFMCMNFATTTQVSAPTTLLGNAVFLPSGSSQVNVLAYTKGASAANIAKVNQVIGWAGQTRGRTAKITAATSAAQVTSMLNVQDYSVLLIHDLVNATPGDPAAAGAAWESGSVLSSFTRAGGVVIVLDGADGSAEMHELISSANLLAIDGEQNISGQQVWNQAPFDAIGINVLSPFLGTSRTCTFQTAVPNDLTTLFVITDSASGGAPVVIHRVIAP